MSKELVIQNLTYQPSKYTDEILKQISEHFYENNFYAILGPNGSGKTTLIRHLLGLIRVQKGNILLHGNEIKNLKKKELATSISFVPQNTYIDADFTVHDIVAMGRNPYQKRFQDISSEDEKLIQEAMEITNTLKLKEKRYNQLSGGEAQRVLVARAITQDTPWMILDEPISHLDIKHQIELMETLKRLNETKKKTVITILHDLNIAASYCNKVVLMKSGEIFRAGDTNDVMNCENLKEVYGIEFQRITNEFDHKVYYVPCML